jgi:SAM-dependent methyltransferase
MENFRKILKVLFRRKGGTTAYRYRLKDNFAGFSEQTKILKEKLKNKNEVFTGWPQIGYEKKETKVLIAQLEKSKIPILSCKVDKDEYEHFLNKINYKKKYPRYYDFNFPEKTLEHFVAFKLLNLQKADKFIDIAAEKSPHSREFSRLTGCTGFRQDIMFRSGIHGRKIGGDASEIPVPDNFFQAALAACSIEHFERDSDIRFMTEMVRVLSKGGKIIILPLYLHKVPFYLTDPRYSLTAGVEFEPGIAIYCVREFQNRHGRFYSPDTLYQRLIKPNKSGMTFTVYYIENFKEIDESNYCRFALVGEKI